MTKAMSMPAFNLNIKNRHSSGLLITLIILQLVSNLMLMAIFTAEIGHVMIRWMIRKLAFVLPPAIDADSQQMRFSTTQKRLFLRETRFLFLSERGPVELALRPGDGTDQPGQRGSPDLSYHVCASDVRLFMDDHPTVRADIVTAGRPVAAEDG